MKEHRVLVFLDLEAGTADRAIRDMGVLREDHSVYHGNSPQELRAFLTGADILCGHNLFHHDLPLLREAGVLDWQGGVIDTLYLSPLLFPRKPYHALLKDDKLQVEELNNPVNDCQKARELYEDEVSAFLALPQDIQKVYMELLREIPEFRDFWREMRGSMHASDQTKDFSDSDASDKYTLKKSVQKNSPDQAGTTGEHRDFPGQKSEEKGQDRPNAQISSLAGQIRESWFGLICENADLPRLIQENPVELAYALAVIGTRDEYSVTPAWVLRNYPKTSEVLRLLCAAPCADGCEYCARRLDIHRGLRRYFGYPEFRVYEGEPLQEQAAQFAMQGESLLVIFPTGGGKSIAFQLPALLQWEAMHGLTVVISPLQSLMKDQVDHLTVDGITSAGSINGMLSPLERSDVLERGQNGSLSMLYIAPEQLRSRTVERLLQSRTISRFVIDEAHCFSSWGQDFRVDYLYIGDFIRQLQEQSSDHRPIPVSCFTATAKQKVVSDILAYFHRKLGLRLTVLAANMARVNLHYHVLLRETDQEKYQTIRSLLMERDGPAIIYASRTKKTRELADRLCRDGFSARAFNGKMSPAEKIENQEAFLQDRVRIMVATSAFGMGVDKKDIGLVIHYDISDSLENYVQEAGRAGRDPGIQAECYILFNNDDLDKHFILLNQTRLSFGEIQQVWKAIRELTRNRPDICCSPLEIARHAGWDTTGPDMETRVTTAIATLENAGFVARGKNVPRVYATSIQVPTMAQAGERIRSSPLFSDSQKEHAARMLQFMISRRSIARAGNDDAEARVDYMADSLGLEKREIIDLIHLLRQEGLLADSQDMSAYLYRAEKRNKSEAVLHRFQVLEQFLLEQTAGRNTTFDLKKLNEAAEQAGIPFSSVRNLRTLLYFWTTKGYVKKEENQERGTMGLTWQVEEDIMRESFARRIELSQFALRELYQEAGSPSLEGPELIPVTFSLVGMFQRYSVLPHQQSLFQTRDANLKDMEDALLYLSRIDALQLEGGFLVLYNGMELHRLKDNRARFKQEDYRLLDEYYRMKAQMIHIVGEFANLMVKDPPAAMQLQQDYFLMDFQEFLDKYFQGRRAIEINLNITPRKYQQLFGGLSPRQSEIIEDAASRLIVVAAGPGSGKTRVLVHKLASLLLMEDVKHEQLLMLTFSRAAATEFKLRLRELIGNAAYFVEIKTFHSYCFDLLGKTGSLEGADNVVAAAVEKIQAGEIEPNRIQKKVLVIDEAQDMDENEYALVRALIAENDTLRVIAVGDDDQNIFEFRGSSARYMRSLADEPGAKVYEMTENYRSLRRVVAAENTYARQIQHRMKSEPLRAVREEPGRVQIIRHPSKRFSAALARQVQASWKGGSAAVLTGTNEEALRLFTLLHRQGLQVKLIQSMDGFSLLQMLEIRVFLNFLDGRLRDRPVISDEVWKAAREHTEGVCAGSSALEICRRLWEDFEETNTTLYRSDLQTFIQESREEDFLRGDQTTLLLSTIHRAKGREFDQVWISLPEAQARTEEEKRRVYVGMTRAKEELYIHTGPAGFGIPWPEGVEEVTDTAPEEDLPEVLLQLGHRDVVLSFFRGKADIIGGLHAGWPLRMEEEYLTTDVGGKSLRVAKLSAACAERIKALQTKGYAFHQGSIRYIVAWKSPEDPEPCWVILPEIWLQKQNAR